MTEEFITERVDHATEYFFNEGINEDGLDLIVEEVGIDEFTAFVIDGPQELNEDEAAYQKARKKAFAGDARREREGKGEHSPKGSSSPYAKQGLGAKTKKKPKIVNTGTNVVAATKKAKKAQPAKPASKEGLGSKIRSTVSKGFERHKAAVGKAKTQVKSIAKTASDTAKQHAGHRKKFVSGLKATSKEKKIAGGIAKAAKKAVTGEEVELEGDSIQEDEKTAAGAYKRATELGAKRRQASYKKYGANVGSPGKNERAGYKLADAQRSRDSSPETQVTKKKKPASADTGQIGHITNKNAKRTTSKTGKPLKKPVYKLSLKQRIDHHTNTAYNRRDPKKNPKHEANK